MRRFAIGLLASSLLTLFTGAQASGLGARMERALAAPSPEGTSRTRRLSSDDIADGLKSMLTDGASLAVLELGAPGGFSDSNSRLISAHSGVQATHLASAAEGTASQAGPILREAINALHFPDPQALLDGDSAAATQFLRDHAAEHLRTELAPVAAGAYMVAARPRSMSSSPAIPGVNARLIDHIAHTTVDALLHTVAGQERLIRRSPAARGTPQVIRVFGAQSTRLT